MEISLYKASKFYQPGEKVTGSILLYKGDIYGPDAINKMEIQATSFMDTVS
jgi:hypothetical protein